MTEIKINKKFTTYEGMLKWEGEHLEEITQGRPVLMLNTESHLDSDDVVLISVTVI